MKMFGFAGWNFVGTTSGLLRDQGINLLFNVCYGPTVNAARGLATQVQSAVGKFTQNFLTNSEKTAPFDRKFPY